MVGTLQFDVFEYRMKNEYNVDLRMTSLPYDHLRLIESMDCHPDEIVLCTGAAVLQDFRDRYLLPLTASGAWVSSPSTIPVWFWRTPCLYNKIKEVGPC